MTRILSIVPYKIFPAITGGQKGIAIFNSYLAKEVELVCISVKANDPSYARSYQMLNILSNSPTRYINLFYVFRIAKYIRKYKPDYILLEHPYYGWLGMVLKKLTGTRLIIHSHNIESLRWKMFGKWWWKLLWHYEKLTHQNADFNFFIHDDDRALAVNKFKLAGSKCITVTYGTELQAPPPEEEITRAKKALRSRHGIDAMESILLFNGAFNYEPNVQALRKVIDVIDPLLREKKTLRYKIVICGKDIPSDISKLQNEKVIIAGFVDDVSEYFKGADVFLNPIIEGGGIKTKLVEALGYNVNAVSTQSGAIGVNAELCNGKLLITADDDWPAFAAAVEVATKIKAPIPDRYFQHFYWGYAIRNALAVIGAASS
jgi:polysaccharide biosynthesis protein PslH